MYFFLRGFFIKKKKLLQIEQILGPFQTYLSWFCENGI